MAPGFYGKHPDFGDFLSAALPAPAEAVLLPFLAQGLALMREGAGDGWHAAFDAAPPVRFWIGATVAGGARALRGVLVPSRDKVGRRYPMIVVAETAAADPASDPDQAFYDAAVARLSIAAQEGIGSARDFAAALACDPVLTPAAETGAVPAPSAPPDRWWAANPALPAGRLWVELSATEHRAAAAARSYWWVAADPAPMAAPGDLPEAGDTDPAVSFAAREVSAPPIPDPAQDAPAESGGPGAARSLALSATTIGHDGLALACPGLPEPAALIWLLTAGRRENAARPRPAPGTAPVDAPLPTPADIAAASTAPVDGDLRASVAPVAPQVHAEPDPADDPPPPADLSMAARIAALAQAAQGPAPAAGSDDAAHPSQPDDEPFPDAAEDEPSAPAHSVPTPADDAALGRPDATDTALGDTTPPGGAFSLSLIEFGQALGRVDDRPQPTPAQNGADSGTDHADEAGDDVWLLPDPGPGTSGTDPAPAANADVPGSRTAPGETKAGQHRMSQNEGWADG